MDRGDKHLCRISGLTERGRGKSLGANIEITALDSFGAAEASAVVNLFDAETSNYHTNG